MFVHAAGVRIVAASDRSITFEIEIPRAEIAPAGDDGLVRVLLDGYGSFSPPGAPEIPGRSFRVALPPEGGYQIASSVLEWESLGRIRLARVFGERLVKGEDGIPITERFMPENPWLDGYAPDIVGAGTASFMGRQRVLPVRVNPLSMEGEAVRLARRIQITVNFTGSTRIPTGAGVKPSAAGAWDRLYQDLLVNPDDVERFRKPLDEIAVQRSTMQVGRRLKLTIPETGLFAVRADSLIDAGLSAGLSTGMIALKKYYYDESEPGLRREVDIPLMVLEDDGGAPGILDGADRLVFYAYGLRDDVDAGDVHALYTNDNVLWLEEDVAGAVMATGTSFAQGTGDPLPSYGASLIEREDTMYWKNAKPGSRDFYFALPAAPAVVSYPITVLDPASAGSFALIIEVQGRNASSTGDNLAFAVRNSTGTHVLGTRTIRTKERFTYNFEANPMDWLIGGENELVISCTRDNVYLIDDYRLEYEAEYVARDDYLEFDVDAGATDRTLEITGFTANSGTLIEITDPWVPIHYELTPAHFMGVSPPYTLSLEMPASVERRFIAVAGDILDSFPISRARLDSDSDLRSQAGPFNTLIISHRSFVAGLGEYVSWRSGQGYRTLLTDVEDVYDEFNGGMPSSDAIKRYIKYGHDHWGVEFVLLVGDGQEDHKQLYYDPQFPYNGSPPDYVPPRSICVAVPAIDYDDEVVSSDNWYAFLDPGEVAAVPAEGAVTASMQLYGYPDVFVGRFPVGNGIELVALITKIMRFEDPGIEDTWRRNIVLLADDAWSGGGDYYMYRSYELEFERSIGRTAVEIEGSLPNGFNISTVNLADWTDGAHDIGETGPTAYSKAEIATRAHCTPYLIRHLNDGCLLFSFQGHAARGNLAKEAPFASSARYSDQDSLRSRLPFVFTGFGCHISEFARFSELSFRYDGDNGDCLTEQLLFKPGSGAVGTYASSAFEYLDQNAVFCERLHREIFQSPPADSVPPENEYTGAHWILAEAITKALIEHLDATSYGFDQAIRYTILGDPMLDIDPGPPVMELEADWGEGWKEIHPDSMRAQNGTNDCRLRFTTSDVIALGGVSLDVDGENWTDSLVITPLSDLDETYARSYSAEMDYTITLEDGSIVYHVFTPEGRETGLFEVEIQTGMRLFYNDYIEILPGVQSPPTGDFKLTVSFPAFISQEPVLLIDGIEHDEIHFTVPDQQDSLVWQADFQRTFNAGNHVLTVRVGEFLKDLAFEVTGGELVIETFNFPNPFTDGTNIVYTLNLPVDAGSIGIYNVSGLLIRTLDIPRFKLDAATYANPHSIYWDGRDVAGNLVANGTYIYVIQIERAGESFDISGKSVRLR